MPRADSMPAPGALPGNYPVLKDRKILAAVEEYVTAKAESERLKARAEELRDTILGAMDGAPMASAGTHILSVTEVRALPTIPNVTITKAMIGQVIQGKKGRAGYIILRVQ